MYFFWCRTKLRYYAGSNMGISPILGLWGKRTQYFYVDNICNLFYPNKLCRTSDPWLENKYYQDPDACDLSELMVVENVVSGRKDIVTLFWENKLGVDVDVRILPFQMVCCGIHWHTG